MSKNPLLYSYRRCPYAMRARMALVLAQINCDVHEVDFKNKPSHMLEISPKGTVPVLVTTDGQVIDESFDIIYWALQQNDPEGLLNRESTDLIAENDGAFKTALDRYKYPNRFSDEDCSEARNEAEKFLQKLNGRLADHKYLLGDRASITDISIFPFIRQCANVDREWFDALPYPYLQNWLTNHIESDLFQHVFQKRRSTIYPLF